jgi:hypothetical protein
MTFQRELLVTGDEDELFHAGGAGLIDRDRMIGLSTMGRNSLNRASGSRVFAREPATPATGKSALRTLIGRSAGAR